MKLRLLRLSVFTLVLGALALTACATVSGKPTVVISSPPSGSQYKEGDDVAVQSTSGDAAGVVRIELDIDGAVVRNDTPPSPQTNFPLLQTWKATPGSHTITVRAYNAAGVSSDPAAVSIQVSPSVALNNPSPTATSSSAAPSATPANTPTATSSSAAPSATPTNTPTPAPAPPGAPSLTPTPTKKSAPPSCTGTPVITSFTVSAPTVAEAILINVVSGTTVTLHWGAVNNADSVEIDHGIGGVPAPGTATDTPGGTTTYTMTAHCGGNSTTTHVTVNVTALPPPPAIVPTVRPVSVAIRVEAGATGTATANCFAGTKVTGGGFAANSSLVVYSNAMEGGNGWEMSAKNISGEYTFLGAYAICVSNISGTISQVFAQVSVPANATQQAIVDCPAGTVLTGGGYAANSDQEVFSNMIHGTNGWESFSKNNTGTAQLLNAYAMCYTGSGVSSTVAVKQVSVSPGSSPNLKADCPSGTLATGGGFAALPGVHVINTVLDDSNGWSSNASNTTGSSQLFNSYAICTHF